MDPVVNQEAKESMIRFLAIILFLFTTHLSAAQNIASVPLRWLSSSSLDLKNNETGTASSEFISRQTEILWKQKSGQSVKHFEIVSVEGAWTDVGSEGAITFHVTEEQASGIVTFERTSSGIFVTLDFTAYRVTAIKRRFQIATIENEN